MNGRASKTLDLDMLRKNCFRFCTKEELSTMYDLCTSTNGRRRTHKKLEKEERTVHDILKYCCVAGD